MITRKPKQKPVSKREPSALDLYYEAFGVNGCVRETTLRAEAEIRKSRLFDKFIKKAEG